jgi:hypothetical protein
MATFTRTEHIEFLDAEIAAQIWFFQQKLESSAITLLEDGELFVAQFLKMNEQGQMMLKFNTERRGIPRRGDYLHAMLVRETFQGYKTWGGITYGNLIRLGQINFSEVSCIWHHAADDPKYTLVGFNGLDMAFAEALVERCIVILGPQEPPIAYLSNLQELNRRALPDSKSGRLLDIDISPVANNWIPAPTENNPHLLLNQLQFADSILVQGPPGSGKTTLIAEIVELLLEQGKRVLVTALTNRALMELASKPALKLAHKEGRIFKAALKWEEKIELPNIQGVQKLYSAPHCLTLATFYIASDWANIAVEAEAFDVVVLDEASQALLAMLAATHQLASKTIWVGDPAQLPPVVVQPRDEVTKRKAWPLVNGMSTIAEQMASPSFQLTHTYRLPPRAAKLTGIFYRNSLQSVEENRPRLFFPEMPLPYRELLHKEGGALLQTISVPAGDPAPSSMMLAALEWILALESIQEPNLKIVVLTKLRKTVRAVQYALTQTLGANASIQVDTVERVQGLTCDFCIFLLPDASLSFALQQSLFNVATSRAKRHTIVIASDKIYSIQSASGLVKEFIAQI